MQTKDSCNLNSNPFSFTGGAYLNQSTGEIVTAYKGTDFLTGAEGRSWNTVADLVVNAGLAFTKDALGTYNGQQLLAASYFLAVKDWAAQNGYDGNKISFTGHSMGGRLVSNMAMWIDRSTRLRLGRCLQRTGSEVQATPRPQCWLGEARRNPCYQQWLM